MFQYRDKGFPNEFVWFWIEKDWVLLPLHRYRRKCGSLALSLSRLSRSLSCWLNLKQLLDLIYFLVTLFPSSPLYIFSHPSHFHLPPSTPLLLFWPPFLSILSNSIGWGGEVRVDPPTWAITHAILAALFSAGPQHPPAESSQCNTNHVASLDQHKIRDIQFEIHHSANIAYIS